MFPASCADPNMPPVTTRSGANSPALSRVRAPSPPAPPPGAALVPAALAANPAGPPPPPGVAAILRRAAFLALSCYLAWGVLILCGVLAYEGARASRRAGWTTACAAALCTFACMQPRALPLAAVPLRDAFVHGTTMLVGMSVPTVATGHRPQASRSWSSLGTCPCTGLTACSARWARCCSSRCGACAPPGAASSRCTSTGAPTWCWPPPPSTPPRRCYAWPSTSCMPRVRARAGVHATGCARPAAERVTALGGCADLWRAAAPAAQAGSSRRSGTRATTRPTRRTSCRTTSCWPPLCTAAWPPRRCCRCSTGATRKPRVHAVGCMGRSGEACGMHGSTVGGGQGRRE